MTVFLRFLLCTEGKIFSYPPDLYNRLKTGIPYYLHKCCGADMAFAKIFMTVLVGVPFVLAVVDVEGSDLIQPKDLVKLIHYSIIIIDNIISGVVDMAGVETYPELFWMAAAIINRF